MAVDFSLLPEEEAVHVKAPSYIIWSVVLLSMVLLGVFAVLFFWPKNMPTQTWKYWVTVILFPVGVPVWIILRRYSIYEGRKLDADLHNEAVRSFKARVFEAASVPLAVLGTAHRISIEPSENSPKHISDGFVRLMAQEPVAKLGDVVRARWLSVPGMPDTAGGKEIDRRRRRHVTAWLFKQLLDDLQPNLKACPTRLRLNTRLSVMNGLTSSENETLWLACWDEKISRPMVITHQEKQFVDLTMLDEWMDAAIIDESGDVMLIVAVQLNPLLAETPPAGAAEAGVALMLAPHALAAKYSIPHRCDLHRPVRAATDRPDEALRRALQWANVSADRIGAAWQTGLDVARIGPLRESARKLALVPRIVDLDQTVGHTGVAAPWLALACAARTPSSEAAEQMVFVGQGDNVDCALLRHRQVS